MSDTPFFTTLHEIEQAVKLHRNPREILAKHAADLRDPDLRREFLRSLSTPDWIRPLLDFGLLGGQSDLSIPREEQETLSATGLEYLLRVATASPEEATAAILEIPLTSARKLNIAIHAAVALSGTNASRLARAISKAVESGVRVYDADELAKLISNLAREGWGEDAVALFTAVTRLSGDGHNQNAAGRLDNYRLLRLLECAVPELVRTDPLPILAILFRMLRTVAAMKGRGEDHPVDDLSYMWRPAIEEHKQNRTHDWAGNLVAPVREATEHAIAAGVLPPIEVIRLLEREEFLIFWRLRLHLINRCAADLPELSRSTMLDRSLFENYRFKHEYARLLYDRFGDLDEKSQHTIFAWIDEGPDLADFRSHFAAHQQRLPGPEEEEARTRYWRYERLWWIWPHLTGERAAEFTRMKEAFGEPEMADLNVRLSTSFGAESPVTPDILRGKDVSAIVQYLRQWEPNAESGLGPSHEGLSGTLATLINEDPHRFASDAIRFCGLRPIYIRTFVDAIRSAVEQDRHIEVEPTLDLCKWAIGQPLGGDAGSQSDFEGERHWGYTRDAVVRFVEAICKKNLPLNLRARLWAALPSVASEPSDSHAADLDADSDLRTHDFTTESLNAPQSRALHAVLEYSRWVHGHLKQGGESVTDLSTMPEVQTVLNERLVESQSYSVWSTFGWWLIPLYVIDKQWVVKNINRIFDLGGTRTHPSLGWAAWNTYLVAHPIYDEFFHILRSQYERTTDLLPELKADSEREGRPLSSLAEHLMVLYGRGTLSINAGDTLVERFFTNATSQLRSHAMTFIGRSLQGYDSLMSMVRDRFTQLWDWYWEEWGRSKDAKSLTGYEFGTWVSSGVFDSKWFLPRLREFASAQPHLEPAEGVVEEVAKHVTSSPLDAIQFLKVFVEGDDDQWRVLGARDQIRAVLKGCLTAGDEHTRRSALQLIDSLGRRGHTEFGELLV